MPKLKNNEEARWRAESDFDTLARAEEIKKEKTRLSAALKVGKEKMKLTEKVVSKNTGKGR